MIKAYRDYWMGYIDFKGRTSVAGYWYAVLANILTSFILSFILGLISGLTQNNSIQTVAPYITSFSLVCILPSLAIVIRRLRDGGNSWANIFWTLLPLVGSIILIIKLCQPSVAPVYPEPSEVHKAAKNDLGLSRIPAAILLLWSNFASIMSLIYRGNILAVDITWWLARLAIFALVIFLFIGKKNIGLLIPPAVYFVLSVIWLIRNFSVYNFIYLAAWASVCAVIVFSTLKSMPKGLVYLPAGLMLLGYLISLGFSVFRGRFSILFIVYFINELLWALSFLFLGKSLVEDPRKQSTGDYYQYGAPAYGAAYGTAYGAQPGYQQPMQQPPQYRPQTSYQPSAPNAQPSASYQRTEPGVLLVRFSIDKLNNLSGSYGFQSGFLIGKAVPPALLEGMAISDGDSAATLAGSEYVCVVSIASINGAVLRDKIQPLILASQQIRENGAIPLTQIVGSSREPLVLNGVVRNGKIEGQGGWCARGLMAAWQESSDQA
ncbi:MAG TPA: DUF805 domain-containing protein [Clostridiales bacterium]|jgi:uncharacterized membrane protein YhaH (DUF805 family)|nr:DUF805 domain-containing protein [Clostridiales bacterium]